MGLLDKGAALLILQIERQVAQVGVQAVGNVTVTGGAPNLKCP